MHRMLLEGEEPLTQPVESGEAFQKHDSRNSGSVDE